MNADGPRSASVRIAVDGVGGDNAPREVVRGALLAVRELGVEVALVGPEDQLRAEAGDDAPLLTFVPASETVAMDEHAAAAARHKRDSSIAVGLALVKSGEAGAFVSAGNTGAVMATALFTLGRAPGIARPAIGTAFPNRAHRPILVLDVGANADADAKNLLQWAQLGAAYATAVFGIAEPRVGLLNIGEESSKGSQLAQEARAALVTPGAGLRFVGNVEPKEVLVPAADVVVTDGFTGNIFIKTAEATAEMLQSEIRDAAKSRPDFLLGGLLMKGAFGRIRRGIDYREFGGAPLLGLNGTAIIAHGRSDARAIRNAIRAGRDAAQGMAANAAAVTG